MPQYTSTRKSSIGGLTVTTVLDTETNIQTITVTSPDGKTATATQPGNLTRPTRDTEVSLRSQLESAGVTDINYSDISGTIRASNTYAVRQSEEQKTLTEESVVSQRATEQAASQQLPAASSLPSNTGTAENPTISRVTTFSESTGTERVTSGRVTTEKNLYSNTTTVTVTDSTGRAVYTGTPDEVRAQIAANPTANSEQVLAAVGKHESSLANQQVRAKVSNGDTAANAVIINDPSPPPPIKVEAVTNDSGNAQSSADPTKEESVPADSKTAANIAANGTRAPDNPVPPTNPGTWTTPLQLGTARVQHPGALTPLRPNQEDAGDSRSGTAINSVIKRTEGEELEDNPLLDYSSYTYNFILAALTPGDYNDLVQKNAVYYNTGYKPRNVIIASAGRQNEELPRQQRFTKDFYITDMKFTTVVGMNARTRASNLAEMQFKIVEPMGVSFFDRLYDMALDLNFKNYLEIPYLLIIEFMGYRDDGTPDQSSKLKSQTKFLPIKLAKIKLNVTASGSEYSVNAIPYNHAAFLTSEHGSAQANFQIAAKTVGEFFAEKDDTTIVNKYTDAQRELDKTIESLKRVREDLGIDATDADIRNAINEEKQTHAKKYHNAQSYAQALNAFERVAFNLKTTGAVNTYRFALDPEIANSPIVEFAKLPSTRASFGNKDANRNSEQNTENGQDGLFAINAGTSNIDVINLVMKNSAYIRNQIKDLPVKSTDDPLVIAEKSSNPLKWFKIVPSVKILDYDEKRNIYTKEITYHIKPYLIANTKSPLVPKSIIRNFMREYKYIFTGDNSDVLDLQIEFDALYYTMATVDKNKWAYLNSSPTSSVDDIKVASRNNEGSIFQPLKIAPVSSNAPMQSGDASIDSSKGIAVSDLWNTIYGSAKGDMININLRIIGDPRYIKQDDVFFTPVENTVNNTLEQSNLISGDRNIVLFDRSERFVKLSFFTPLDYGENGLLEKTDRYKTSRFTGIYRVIKIENVFSKGKFEQNIQIVRVFGQDTDYERYKAEQAEADIQRLIQEGDMRALVNDALNRDKQRKPDSSSPEKSSGSSSSTSVITSPSVTVQTPAPTSSALASAATDALTRLDTDPNTNPNETPADKSVSDKDRLAALRIQNERGDATSTPAEPGVVNQQVAQPPPIVYGVPHWEAEIRISNKLIAEYKEKEQTLLSELNAIDTRAAARAVNAARESGASPAEVAGLQQNYANLLQQKADINFELKRNNQRLSGAEDALQKHQTELYKAQAAAGAPVRVSKTPSQEDAG